MSKTSKATATLISLLQRGHKEYDIVYGGFLSNHMSHGLIALYHMGATPSRLTEFYEEHSKHQNSGHSLEPARSPKFKIHADSWDKHQSEDFSPYPELYVFFEEQMRELGREECVRQYLPKLISLMPSFALHPFIHIGLGCTITDTDIPLIEGMASAASCYTNVHEVFDSVTESSEEPVSLMTVIKDVHNRPGLADIFAKFGDEQFSEKFAILNREIGKEVAESVLRWEKTFPVASDDEREAENVKEMERDVGRAALLAHRALNCEEFFILHGVTSFQAMTKIVNALESLADKRTTIRYFAYTLVQVYVMVGAPTLPAVNLQVPAEITWEDILEPVLVSPTSRNDEHQIKLIWTCHDLVQLYDEEEDVDLLKSTALTCVRHEHHGNADYKFNLGLKERGII